jgi:hypothetical protein
MPAPTTLNVVNYSDVRSQMEDCDIILFHGTVLGSRIIEDISKSVYSHSGLIAYWGDRLMLLQAEIEGLQAIPLSVGVGQYPGRVDWYKPKPEYRAKLNVKAALDEARADLGLSYATADLLKAGVDDLMQNVHSFIGRLMQFKLPGNVTNPNALFCSEYVERCYRVGGVPLKDTTDVQTTPGDIADSPVVVYQATIQHVPEHLADRRADVVNA